MPSLKQIVTLTILIYSLNSYGQISFQIGPTVGLNSTWIINPNTIITDQEIKPELTLTSEVGGTTLLKFGKSFGLGAGISFGKLSQKYNWDSETTSQISMNSINIPIFLHFGNRFYNESGIQFSSYNKALLTIQDEFEQDVENAFNSNNLYAFSGFGYSIHFSPKVFLNLGLRFGYGIEDLYGVTPQGYDYEGLNDFAAFINNGTTAEEYPEFEEYEEYTSYFESAEDFAATYERLNKTYGFFATFSGSLVINFQGIKKTKDPAK